MRRRVRGSGCFAAVAGLVCLTLGACGAPASAAAAPGGSAVVVGCLGVDSGPTGSQIRVGFLVSGPDGLYRAAFAGPSGAVQGEGRVAGGRGLVIVPTAGAGAYDHLVLTNVDSGQAVDSGPLDDGLPVQVGRDAVPCDPTTLVAPTTDTAPTAPTTPAPTDATAAPTTVPTGVPTPDISTAAPLPLATEATTSTDTPPWLLLAIPGGLLVIGGVVLLVRARSGSRSRPAT